MANHIWDVKRLMPGKPLLDCVYDAVNEVVPKMMQRIQPMDNGVFREAAPCTDLCFMFIGYVIERQRMAGRGNYNTTAESIWDSVEYTGFRFTTGKNRNNYLRAGKRLVVMLAKERGLTNDPHGALCRLIQALAPTVDLVQEAPAEMVLDKMVEEHKLPV